MKLFWKYCAVVSACVVSFTLFLTNPRVSIENLRSDNVHLYLTLGKYAGSENDHVRLISTRVKKDAEQLAIGVDLHSFHQVNTGVNKFKIPVQPGVKITNERSFKVVNKSITPHKTINRKTAIRHKRQNTIIILDEYGLIPQTKPPKELINNKGKFGNENMFSLSNNIKVKDDCFKKILIWEDRSRDDHMTQSASTFFCADIPCKLKVSYSNGSIEKITEADAVVIYHSSKQDLPKMITKRKAGQKWILATRESPLQSSIEPPDNLRSVYDWIMTYRQGADFSLAWGYFDRGVPQWKEGLHINWASGKNKFLAWNKPNCSDTPSHYKEFVSKLNNYLPVHIPPSCRFNCNYNTNECLQSIRQFKFFLALENSECKDYITEMFWETSLQNNVVPIVFGAPKQDYERTAPPHSFIHVNDFKNIADLANYLKKLDNNDNLYNEYFLWKKDGKIVSTRESWEFNSRDKMCEVARKLRQVDSNPEATNKQKIYDNIVGPWWKGSCTQRRMPH